MKKLLIYDLDGTLVDTRKDIVDAANAMRVHLGYAPLEGRRIEQWVGRGLRFLVEQCLGEEASEKTVRKGMEFFKDYYGVHMLDHSRLYPGAYAFLWHFRDRYQSLVTNKPNPFTLKLIESLGIRNFFSEVLCAQDGFPPKPDPAAVQFCMKKFKVRKDEVLLVGDSAVDIETAKRAEIECAILSHGFSSHTELQCHQPTYLTTDFHSLLEVAKREGW